MHLSTSASETLIAPAGLVLILSGLCSHSRQALDLLATGTAARAVVNTGEAKVVCSRFH